MIKAVGFLDDGEKILVLGLSYGNLRLLKEDEPIMFDGRPLGYDGKILIMAGPTEEAIARLLKRNNPDVVVEEDPTL